MLCDFTKIPINGKCVCYCVCVFLVRDRIEKNRLVKGRKRESKVEREEESFGVPQGEGGTAEQSRAVCERSS